MPAREAPGALPLPRRPRYDSLDVWRGAACIAVVVFHSVFHVRELIPRSSGDPASWVLAVVDYFWVTVPIFLVISGYCIAAIADTSRHGRIGVGQYIVRRLRRVFPPYWICLVLTLGVLWVAQRTMPAFFEDRHDVTAVSRYEPWELVGNFTLTEGWRKNVTGE